MFVADLYREEPQRLAALIRHAEIWHLRASGIRVGSDLGSILGVDEEWFSAVIERDFEAILELPPASPGSAFEGYVSAVFDHLVRYRFNADCRLAEIIDFEAGLRRRSGYKFHSVAIQMLIRSSLGETVPIDDVDAATRWCGKNLVIIGLMEQLAMDDEEAHEVLRRTASSAGGQSD
jgi:hypothetical protein